ncbi:hypothetical protein PoB_003760300 [Plakobranchus ocellatus]|uniref:Uncharacterized protein n=1 Tax=Plakobranchus ocellatus TaxID=259542 RepID=A0AAV4AX57_9GAST|nr:hypothetical protein PoB_003760300 [Plakobranchus ocellatus]
MPQCRRDQRTFAIWLVVMVTVETLIIFTIMHWEHTAAEAEAERRREERRIAREIDYSQEGNGHVDLRSEIDTELRLKDDWAARKENFGQNERPAQKKQAQNRRPEHDGALFANRTGDMGLMKEDWENPKFKRIHKAKVISGTHLHQNQLDLDWIGDIKPRANRRIFTKEAAMRRRDGASLTSDKSQEEVKGQPTRPRLRPTRPRPQLYDDDDDEDDDDDDDDDDDFDDTVDDDHPDHHLITMMMMMMTMRMMMMIIYYHYHHHYHHHHHIIITITIIIIKNIVIAYSVPSPSSVQ